MLKICSKLYLIAKTDNKLLKEIKLQGWTEEQLHQDGFNIWRKGDNFLVSSGDWAKIHSDDIIKSIEHLYPKCNIEYDAEVGPQDETWEKIF